MPPKPSLSPTSASSDSSGALAATGLGCLRGERPVFAGLEFRLEAGGMLLLTGPNGSGKSSLLRVLAALLRPAAGRLLWDGVDVRDDLDAHHARLHYLGHLDANKPALSVRENLLFWSRLRGAAAEQAETALATFDLGGLAELPGRLLSAGQKRRLALARLLAASAPLWLLDEPTVGLDSDSIARLVEALSAHRRAGGLVVLATHVEIGQADVQRLDMRDFRPAAPDLDELLL